MNEPVPRTFVHDAGNVFGTVAAVGGGEGGLSRKKKKRVPRLFDHTEVVIRSTDIWAGQSISAKGAQTHFVQLPMQHGDSQVSRT